MACQVKRSNLFELDKESFEYLMDGKVINEFRTPAVARVGIVYVSVTNTQDKSLYKKKSSNESVLKLE